MRRFWLILTLTAVVVVSPHIALALSYEQVSQKAKEITVIIDGCSAGSGMIFRHEGNNYSVLTAKQAIPSQLFLSSVASETKNQQSFDFWVWFGYTGRWATVSLSIFLIIAWLKEKKQVKILKNIPLERLTILIIIPLFVPVGFFLLGTIHHQLGDYTAAIADYNQAIKLDPNFSSGYYGRGIAHYKLGDNTAAIADYQKAAELYKQQGKERDYQDALNKVKKLSQQ